LRSAEIADDFLVSVCDPGEEEEEEEGGGGEERIWETLTSFLRKLRNGSSNHEGVVLKIPLASCGILPSIFSPLAFKAKGEEAETP